MYTVSRSEVKHSLKNWTNENYEIFYSDITIKCKESNEVIAIYESDPKEKSVFCADIQTQDILKTFLILKDKGHQTKRSSLCSGSTYTWGYQFNTFPYNGVIRNPWTISWHHSLQMQIFLERYLKDLVLPIYRRLTPSIAQQHEEFAKNRKNICIEILHLQRWR